MSRNVGVVLITRDGKFVTMHKQQTVTGDATMYETTDVFNDATVFDEMRNAKCAFCIRGLCDHRRGCPAES